MRTLLLCRSALIGQQLFIKETDQKPAGEIVRTDDLTDMPSGSLIVPRAELLSGKQAAGDKFGKEDQQGID